jgi:UDP-N-acetylglucosamine--N-acetylmuramyl-(pentapeptide) pyrophosphoryl-undecaprenol N-acetylglucosamine transferase
VVHQTGQGNEHNYPAGPRYRPYPYIRDEMPHVLAAAELVVGRSGAGTVWECAALGKPMVLVPLSGNSRGDQVENARFFEKAGAAVCLTGADLTNENLVRVIDELASDSHKREAMARASREIGQLDALSKIITIITELTGK